MAPKSIDKLAEVLSQAPDEVFIQPHNIPDPDAIAASFGLQSLLKEMGVDTVIVYEQELARPDARRMLKIFDIEMKTPPEVSTLGEEDWTVLVNVQKTADNLTDLVSEEVACIDYHDDNGYADYRFRDIRSDYGSSSAIIADYWRDTGKKVPVPVATSLLYGIRSATDGLSLGVTKNDIEAYYRLYSRADMSRMTELLANSVDYGDLKKYADAFNTVEIYGNTGFIRLDSEDESLLASAGDTFLSVEGVDVVVAYAVRRDGVKYYIRSVDSDINAAELVRHMVSDCGVAGGHATMAGGFVRGACCPANRSVDTYSRIRAIDFIEKDVITGRR